MEDLDTEDARAIIDPALLIMVEAGLRGLGRAIDGRRHLRAVAPEDHPRRALCGAVRLQEQMRTTIFAPGAIHRYRLGWQ